MYSRWFNVAVFVLWLSAMSWLMIEKVLPPLLVGEPPSYRTILKAREDEAPVGWNITFNDRKLGWALCTTSRLPNQLTEINSRVRFDELRLRDMAHGWLRGLLRVAEQQVGSLEMDARSTLTIDPLGRLLSFDSTVRLDPLDQLIKLKGTIEGTQLKLEVRSGDSPHTTEAYLPADALLDDALSPQTQLPGLHTGQSWRVQVYSPFPPFNQRLELLQATVEGTEPIIWGGRTVEAWLVVYRSDSGFWLGSHRAPRGRLWVRRDGTVLKQEMMIFGSTMTFDRLTDDQAAALAKEVHGRR